MGNVSGNRERRKSEFKRNSMRKAKITKINWTRWLL